MVDFWVTMFEPVTFHGKKFLVSSVSMADLILILNTFFSFSTHTISTNHPTVCIKKDDFSTRSIMRQGKKSKDVPCEYFISYYELCSHLAENLHTPARSDNIKRQPKNMHISQQKKPQFKDRIPSFLIHLSFKSPNHPANKPH
jgi:hypothetical protein